MIPEIMEKQETRLKFGGSIWCNLDIALRSVDYAFRQVIRPAGLTVIEWYILRALFQQDGQHASELARAVGRAATSFTPNLDKLQQKGYVERRPDPGDRRAVHIFLTESARKIREEVLESAQQVDEKLAALFSPDEMRIFDNIILTLQQLDGD